MNNPLLCIIDLLTVITLFTLVLITYDGFKSSAPTLILIATTNVLTLILIAICNLIAIKYKL